ncbi:MAG: lipid-binding SYLF domain-containing protein [Pyrinomonadaceae bacterium MAG19_C2-C3]|nr:lipid-binding SYLF domain-containing protein [Pyrinomonadaceae bacterium MAG19_C2-C3]
MIRQHLKYTKHFPTLTLLCALVLTAGFAANAQTARVDRKKLNEASNEARDAVKVLNQTLSAPDGGIPKELLDRAEAIAVFPGVLRAAFIIGGRGGDGVISRRTANGWSAPAFFNLGGGSFGAQIGASKTDFILLFMNDGALKGLLEDKFEIGGEIGVAAGPYGRQPGASTNLTLDAGILSYARQKGAYIGAALKGVVINPDNNLNEAIYAGKKANQILGAEGAAVAASSAPANVRVFPQALSRYSTRN